MMGKYLFPFNFKWLGGILTLLGLIGFIIYLSFDFRIMMPAFAIYSSFFETRLFCVVRTNIVDEIILLLLLAGFLFLSFSRERNETETLDQLRSRALFRAFATNTILLGFSTLFFFGNGFLLFIFLNLFSVQVLYLLFFHISRWKTFRKA